VLARRPLFIAVFRPRLGSVRKEQLPHALVGTLTALLDLDPAILRRPPRSDNIEYALVDAKAHLIPLTRVWPMPDYLPHAAVTGDLARAKRWFDVADFLQTMAQWLEEAERKRELKR
jgi:hypothetical protein